MKITKTKRMLSILLTFMMMVSVFSILSVTSASADDTPTQAYVVIKPTITTIEDALDGSKTFSVTASVEDRSKDIVYLSSINTEQLETCEQDAIDYGYAWNHCYKITFRVYGKTGYDISNLKYIYVKDGKCSYYASLYKGSDDTGFYQNSGQSYVTANIIFIPFQVCTYKNSEYTVDYFFGLEKAKYWCSFSSSNRHIYGYEMATTFRDDMTRTFNGYYPDTVEPTATGFYYSVPRSKSYDGKFGYYGVGGAQTDGTKTIRSDAIRRRFIVAAMTEYCTAGTPTVTTAATCTTTGTKTTKCTVCGKTLKTETIAALGHDYSVLKSTTPATCTTGTKKVYKCSRCSATKTVTSNDALGHDYSVLQSQTPATCTTGTKSVYTCSRCSATKTVTADDALGHNYVYDSERSTPATVYEEGQEVYHCTRCDDHYVAKVLSKKTEDSGFLKGGCAYHFDANTGTLTISPVFGKTTTGDYFWKDDVTPWADNEYKKLIKNLVIEEGITEIGDYAFTAVAISSLTTPTSLTRIGEDAFAFCNSLENITINGTNCVIEDYAFDSCEGKTLEAITLNGVKSVGYDAFYEVDSKKLELGNIETIGNSAFSLNETLTEVTIPATCTSLDTAFASCSKLTKFTVLNPECNILSEDWGIPESATICCYTNSTAHQFAQKYNRTVELLDATPEVESVSLNRSTMVLGVGQSYTLRTALVPEDAETTFKWKSSKKDIATVTSLGKVTGRAVGRTTITVTTENGKTATCTVTVRPAPTSIELNKTEMTLGVGQMYTLQTTMTPSNAATYQTWTTSNKTVATVTSSGKVTGKKVGTAVITVKTTNGLTASCTVTVKKAPTAVELSKTAVNIGVGQKYTLTATLTPSDSFTYCTWTSSDTSIATVTSGGIVTGKKTGTATIMVKTTNGLTAECTVRVKKAPDSISLDKTSLTLAVGKTYTFTKTLSPTTAAAAYSWTSSDTSVATVNSSGKVTAKKAGTATITVTTHNGKTASCEVTVK